jgi:hypothetical protein
MDPPRDKPPPPPPAPRDGFGDGRREEDESNRRKGDDRDIGFCGIEQFYKLGAGASVSSCCLLLSAAVACSYCLLLAAVCLVALERMHYVQLEI